MNKRIRIAAAAAAVIALGLTGCAGTTSGDDGRVTLRFATPDSGPGAEHLQSVVDAYNESQEEVEVKLEAYGDAFDQKLTSQIGAGNAPDIMKMWNFPAYYSILEPLNGFIDAMPDKDDFYPTLFSYAEMDGKVYGFPTGFSTRAIYYNTDLAEKAGLTAPESWTSDDYVEWVKAIAATGDGAFGGDQLTNPDAYSFESFLLSNGGEWLDDDGEPVADSKQNIEVVEFLHDLAYGDTASAIRKHPASEDTSKVFMAGDLGTFEFGKWFTQTFTENNTPYGILPMFSFGDNAPKSVVHAGFVSISKDTEYKEEAEDFITWMSSPENVRDAAAYDMPIRISIADELGLTTDPINKPFFDMLVSSEGTQSSMLKNEEWPDISAEIGATLEKIFSNEEIDVAEQLHELQATLESL